MTIFKTSILKTIFNEQSCEEMLWLVFPGRHISLLSRRRAVMILSRVRLISILFAVLTTLFIAVDLLLLPWPVSGELGAGRILASAGFIVLACLFQGSSRMRDAYYALAIMFAIPTMFFAFSFSLLSSVRLEGIVSTITATYAILPIIMVAGLSMFPLTATEGAMYAVPVLAAEVISSWIHMDAWNLSPLISSAWLVIIIAVVATLSGMSQLGFMIDLVHTAIRDTLTGCFSRMSGMELLEIQFIIARRSGSPLAVAFIDLDNFKSINDTYGHEAGDQALVDAARRINASLRTGDMLARWGGEEFILIMPNTYTSNAINAVERLRESGFGMRPDGQAMTASIGIAERTEDHAEDWKALIEIADQRMYAAKQSGKNRVVAS